MAPSFGVMGNTVTLTVVTSTLIIVSMLTDHWEYVDFDHRKVRETVLRLNYSIEWIEYESIAKIGTGPNRNKTFLVPLYGGVWHVCMDISAELEEELREEGLTTPKCQNYLISNRRPSRKDWVGRMQNLSISCAMVSLILLGTSALVGIFGVFRTQLSALLVTGVMYILTGLFGIFTLTIMHFKRTLPMSYTHTKIDSQIPRQFLHCRTFTNGWSASIGWAGVTLVTFTSLLWILLSKLMR